MKSAASPTGSMAQSWLNFNNNEFTTRSPCSDLARIETSGFLSPCLSCLRYCPFDFVEDRPHLLEGLIYRTRGRSFPPSNCRTCHPCHLGLTRIHPQVLDLPHMACLWLHGSARAPHLFPKLYHFQNNGLNFRLITIKKNHHAIDDSEPGADWHGQHLHITSLDGLIRIDIMNRYTQLLLSHLQIRRVPQPSCLGHRTLSPLVL